MKSNFVPKRHCERKFDEICSFQPPFVHDKDAEGKVLTFFSFGGMHFKFINAKAPQSTQV